jgi:hypothetical protein
MHPPIPEGNAPDERMIIVRNELASSGSATLPALAYQHRTVLNHHEARWRVR